MSNWINITLGSIGKFHKGSGIPRDEANSGVLPAVRYGELYTNYDTFIYGKTRSSISQKVANTAFRLQSGDIVFAGSGETVEDIGKSAVYLGKIGYAGGDIIILRPDIKKADARFLALYFETELWKRQRRRAAQGQSVVHIHACDLSMMTINLPDLETQQKIVQIIGAWDYSISIFERYRQAQENIFHYLCCQLYANKQKNNEKDLGALRRMESISKISAGGDVPKEAFSKHKTPEFNVPIISNGVGDDAIYGYTNIKKISAPCITIAARGTIGYAAFRDKPFYPIVRLICVIPDRKVIMPKFLYYQLNGMKLVGTSGGIPQLTIPMISKYKVRVPDLETQQKIVQILEAWDCLVDDLDIYISNLKKHKKYLLNHLISGDFDLSNIKFETKESK